MPMIKKAKDDLKWEDFIIFAVRKIRKLQHDGQKILITVGGNFIDLDTLGKSITLGQSEYDNKDEKVTDEILMSRLLDQVR